jgi:hypothetical protein
MSDPKAVLLFSFDPENRRIPLTKLTGALECTGVGYVQSASSRVYMEERMSTFFFKCSYEVVALSGRLCDLYSGEQWAHKYISAEIMTSWPDAPEPVRPAPAAA